MSQGTVVVVGGTQGLGRRLSEYYAAEGRDVLITGRDGARAQAVAEEINGQVRGATLELTDADSVRTALADVESVRRVVLAAIERDSNSVRDYDIAGAIRLATLKLVGYTQVVAELCTKFHDEASVLMFGGLAKDKPYPGSTTVTSVNGAVMTMVRTLALELAPVRVNALHPGIVGDSPAWENNAAMLDNVLQHTPTRRLVTMADITDAAVFLLENQSVNGVNLDVDGGWLMG